MSFLKFWGKKSKKEEADPKRDEIPVDPEAEKRKLRHSLSISRSGRFKQRKRERGQILDQPDLFTGQNGDVAQDEDGHTTSSSSSLSTASHSGRPALSSSHQRSPNNTCRNLNPNMAAGSLRMGQSVAT